MCCKSIDIDTAQCTATNTLGKDVALVELRQKGKREDQRRNAIAQKYKNTHSHTRTQIQKYKFTDKYSNYTFIICSQFTNLFKIQVN